MSESAEDFFHRVIGTLYDNSMGDYNDYPFFFISSIGKDEEFKDYLIESLRLEIEQRGYDDGIDDIQPDSVVMKIPELKELYWKAYTEGVSENG